MFVVYDDSVSLSFFLSEDHSLLMIETRNDNYATSPVEKFEASAPSSFHEAGI